MKKIYFILFTISTVCLLSVFAQNEDKFIDALRTCSPLYKESDTINVGGVNAISTKSMSGWNNNICVYKEIIKMNGMNITTTCNFTKKQTQEIVSVADAYYLTMRYNSEKIDTSSPEAVKNNPLFNVMNKYLQDSSVCTMSGLE